MTNEEAVALIMQELGYEFHPEDDKKYARWVQKTGTPSTLYPGHVNAIRSDDASRKCRDLNVLAGIAVKYNWRMIIMAGYCEINELPSQEMLGQADDQETTQDAALSATGMALEKK